MFIGIPRHTSVIGTCSIVAWITVRLVVVFMFSLTSSGFRMNFLIVYHHRNLTLAHRTQKQQSVKQACRPSYNDTKTHLMRNAFMSMCLASVLSVTLWQYWWYSDEGHL